MADGAPRREHVGQYVPCPGKMSLRGKVKASPAPGEDADEDAEEDAAEREMFVEEAEAAGEEGGHVHRDAEAATSSRQTWMRCCFERVGLDILYAFFPPWILVRGYDM